LWARVSGRPPISPNPGLPRCTIDSPKPALSPWPVESWELRSTPRSSPHPSLGSSAPLLRRQSGRLLSLSCQYHLNHYRSQRKTLPTLRHCFQLKSITSSQPSRTQPRSLSERGTGNLLPVTTPCVDCGAGLSPIAGLHSSKARLP
jgi:hypothetical protein